MTNAEINMSPMRPISLIGSIALISLMGLLWLISLSNIAQASGLIKPANNLGLVGYWNFEDATGTKATDFSGGGNTGTLTNMEAADWVSGKFGKALIFDGANEYVELTDDPYNLTDLTISTWVKTTATGRCEFVTKGASANYEYGLAMNYSSAGIPAMNVFTAAGGTYLGALGSSPINDGQWHHIVGVVTGTTALVYADGVEVGSDTTPSGTRGTGGTANLQIAGRADGNNDYSGSIDDTRIYNRALSATEIAALYNSSGIAKQNASLNNFMTNGLVGLWSFDGADLRSTTAYDRSGQGNNGAITGGATVIEGRRGQALSFDGVGDYVDLGDKAQFALTSNYSFAFWMKPATLTGDTDIVAIGGSSANNIGLQLTKIRVSRTSASIRVVAGDGTLWVPYGLTMTSILALNQWVHIACTVDTAQLLTCYKDGALHSTDDLSGRGGVPTGNYFTLGLDRDSQSIDYAGLLDDVRIYNRVLSANEINLLYRAGNLQPNSSIGGITDGLVAWHTFDGPRLNSTTSTDSSAQGNNGTLSGGPTTVIGKVGQALKFDGANDYVNADSPSVLDNIAVKTISLWIKRSDLIYAGLIAKGRALADQGWIVAVRGTTPENYEISYLHRWSGGAGYAAWSGSTPLSDTSTWYHAVIIYDSSSSANDPVMYVNGTLQTITEQFSPSGTEGDDSANNLIMGIWPTLTSDPFNGSIDEVRIYNRALSAAEIKLLYNATK